MNSTKTVLSLAAALLLAACGSRDAAGEQAGSVMSSIADEVAEDIRTEMAHENFGVGGADGLPKAELTPEGDLLIDGTKIVLTAEQRTLARAYRESVIDIAEAGARVGLQGAEVAKEAATAAIAGVLTGNEPDIEARIKGSTDRIKVEARKLCDALPELLAQEQALAKAVPEFAPYADMTQADIEDCAKEIETT